MPIGKIKALYDRAESNLKDGLEKEKHAEHPRGITGNTCPHCVYKQSWGIKRALLSEAILTAIGWFLLGVTGSTVAGILKLSAASWKIYGLSLLFCSVIFFSKPLAGIVSNGGVHARSFPAIHWETISEISGTVILTDHDESKWKIENREIKIEYRWSGENDWGKLPLW